MKRDAQSWEEVNSIISTKRDALSREEVKVQVHHAKHGKSSGLLSLVL